MEALTCAVQNAQLPHDPAVTRFPGVHNGGTAVDFPTGAGKVQHRDAGVDGGLDCAGPVNTAVSGAGLGRPAGCYTDGNVTSAAGGPAGRSLEARAIP